jgi:hypothetical protein
VYFGFELIVDGNRTLTWEAGLGDLKGGMPGAGEEFISSAI